MSLSSEEIEKIATKSAEDALCKLNLTKPAAEEKTGTPPGPSVEDDPYARLKPMRQWMEEKLQEDSNAEKCKPCILGPVVNWYYTELEEQGKTDEAKTLEVMVEGLNEEDTQQLLKLCGELDRLKETADETLRARFRDFDCEIQNLEVDELAQELENKTAPDEPETASP